VGTAPAAAVWNGRGAGDQRARPGEPPFLLTPFVHVHFDRGKMHSADLFLLILLLLLFVSFAFLPLLLLLFTFLPAIVVFIRIVFIVVVFAVIIAVILYNVSLTGMYEMRWVKLHKINNLHTLNMWTYDIMNSAF
jgi:hypothetical protein